MAPRIRKLALTAHLTFAIGWVGTVAAYIGLGIAAATSQDAQTVRSAWIAMEITGWYVIVPFAVASLFTGLVMALGTGWGLLRHYWVLISFGLTVFAAGVLIMHMPTVSAQADIARDAGPARLDALGGDLSHPVIGLVVLLVIQVLNVYKPRGMTRYGQRKSRVERQRRRPQGDASGPRVALMS